MIDDQEKEMFRQAFKYAACKFGLDVNNKSRVNLKSTEAGVRIKKWIRNADSTWSKLVDNQETLNEKGDFIQIDLKRVETSTNVSIYSKVSAEKEEGNKITKCNYLEKDLSPFKIRRMRKFPSDSAIYFIQKRSSTEKETTATNRDKTKNILSRNILSYEEEEDEEEEGDTMTIISNNFNSDDRDSSSLITGSFNSNEFF